MTWQFTLSGFLIGVLVGLTGMGGGSLLTPILVIFFGFKPTLAVGTDVLHGAIFKSFGAVRHRRLGTVHARLTLWMFLGSGPMSLLGVAAATWLSHHSSRAEDIEAYAIGAALVIGGAGLVAKTFIKRGVQPDDAPFILDRRDKLIALTLGATCGFVVGLTSVGSGTFFGLVMVLVFPLTLPKIVGTDIFHAAALLWVAGFGPPRRGQRGHPHDGLAPDRFDPRRPALESVHAEGAGSRAAVRARLGVDAERDQAARLLRSGLRDRRRRDRGRARLRALGPDRALRAASP
jgi:uncharacterized membrane protein YfcA